MGSGHRTGRSLAATQTKTNQALGAIPGHAGCRFGPRTAGTTRAARRQKTLQIPQTQQTPPSLRRALESKQTPPGRHSQKTKWSYLSAIPPTGQQVANFAALEKSGAMRSAVRVARL